MAWIYNKKTKVKTECHNVDVIKLCKKDVDSFIVHDNVEKLNKIIEIEKDGEKGNEPKDIAKMNVEELKAIAKEKGLDGIDSLTKKELLELLK